ncbi:hypothetical protein F5B19DRAFT_22054 [Rostrohypoxylon terebratum]|nr:hypothetical protein F5B19DRAFT_22054 [Rostrohypoxylon terebratum]
METVNNMASAAAKAVWGESKQNSQEPISGHTGDPSKGEPYDAGNIEDPKAQAAKLEASGEKPSTNGTNEAAHFSKQTGTAAETEDTPNNPSADLKAKSGPKDTSKSQADTRDPENPSTNPRNAPTDVNDAEEGVNEAQKLDGPGPKPIEEVAREHGGDAGISGESVDKTKKTEGEEDEDGPNAKSKGEGTGEQYVKSTGLKADGGDFDATKPGAGREADRIMEEKGMHVNGGEGGEAGHGGKKERKSIGQKIKNKLHRH